MIRLGLTGGIGSGKSVVAEFFRLCGIPVYDCDREAKRLMVESPEIRNGIVSIFGEESFLDGQLNRPHIAGIAFQHPELLSKLNRIVHPEVRKDYHKWCDKQNTDLVLIESAILFDSGLYRHVDKILTVTAKEAVRVQRVMQRDHSSEGQIKDRMRNQMDEAERILRSDFVTINDNIHPIIPQLTEIIAQCRLLA
jgi:dephospho-CoA kinase